MGVPEKTCIKKGSNFQNGGMHFNEVRRPAACNCSSRDCKSHRSEKREKRHYLMSSPTYFTRFTSFRLNLKGKEESESNDAPSIQDK